ncbi:RNA polymerase sigma24 factor [Actinoplanes lobatus]|uniref:RNA polymerase sigma-70 factor (ECF subfamily) n=1 Tax=Actinoplanes lobatus TaxID=113568 RepID=A0A7W7HEW1_9ACTN|nr:RNA polymerase sigma factor [Actinoplanes lobatus]MBB4749286.1 RNA polymerase sigma-70 factor (ECF subfamily) [Actinoplanes lobatus]GGN79918.1 RNA polymerase sigma24 factor [Actinoplanes lobatus]GIE40225.1 RNA polymerase sigma24 factor [Actinoplanes lobatus]
MVASEDLDAVVSAAQAGDEEAFRRLYRAQQPALVRYLRVLVGDDAEDVASESWLQIARDLRKFSGDWDGFRGWTATIARHRAMDLLRAQRRRPQASVPVEFLAEMSAGDDTADRALELVTTDDAVALIASLPPEMAEAVMLRVVVGLDATSTGQILGRRAGAVRTAAYRGLRQLAAKLAQRDPRHPPEPPRSPSRKPAVTTSAAPALKEMR